MEEKSVSTRRDFRRGGLSVLDRARAVWEGVKDGRRGLPALPLSLTRDGTVPPATQGFVGTVQARVDQVSQQHLAWLREQHADLVAEITARASDVAYHQDVAKDLTRAHAGRFTAALSLWSEAAFAQRARVQAAVARGSQQLAWYWAVVQRHHVRLRAIAKHREDPPVTQWSPKPGVVAARTVTIDLSVWRPAPVRLDPEWDNPVKLLMQLAVARDDPHLYQYGALARALQIVYGQA